MTFIKLLVLFKKKVNNIFLESGVISVMSPDLSNRCYRCVEDLAEFFSRVPTALFYLLALVHANFWITKFYYRLMLCILHSMMVLHLPMDYVAVVKRNVAWARELSYTKPSDWLFAYHRYYNMSGRVDVVLAHYKEDLSWLTDYLSRIDHLYLYCKDEAACRKGLPENLQGAKLVVTHLTNEGREANTYLHHIINYYDHLPDRIVFSMASLNGNWMRKLAFIFALTEPNKPRQYCYNQDVIRKLQGFQMHNRYVPSVSLGDGYEKGMITIYPAEFRPLKEWMGHYLPFDVYSNRCRFGDSQHGAIFSTTREDIQKISQLSYQKLLIANQGADLMEAGYFMERIWRFMLAAKTNH